MGDWTVVVSGQGSHHNGTPGDADRLAQRFVEDLVEAQQMVRVAIVSYGGLGVLDSITPERERYERQLIATSQRDPVKSPYESIAERLAEFDERTYDREKALGTANLLPAARQKAHMEARVTHGEDIRVRWAPGSIRSRSFDGGKTWEPYPEPGDVVTTLADISVVGYTPNGDALILRGEALSRFGGKLEDHPEPARSAGAAASSILADGSALCTHCQHFEGEHDKKDGRCRRRMGKIARNKPVPSICVCTGFVPWVAPRVMTGGLADPMDGPLPIIGGANAGVTIRG